MRKGWSPTKDELDKLLAAGKISGFTWPEGSKEKAPKKNKYNAQKVVFDGMEFDSKKEARVYFDLKLRVLANEIRNLRRQVEYKLEYEGKKLTSYIADFVFEEHGKDVIADAKSNGTRKLRMYMLKKKMLKIIYSIEIVEL